jgi:hypothetical protein
MILRQVFGDGKPFLIYKQQAVAILVYLHVVTGTNPSPMLYLFFAYRDRSDMGRVVCPG